MHTLPAGSCLSAPPPPAQALAPRMLSPTHRAGCAGTPLTGRRPCSSSPTTVRRSRLPALPSYVAAARLMHARGAPAPAHCNVTFAEFLATPWRPLEPVFDDPCHADMATYCPKTQSSHQEYEQRGGEFAGSVLEMRAWKLQRVRKLCNTRRQAACVRYEDLMAEPKNFLDRVRQRFHVDEQPGYFQPVGPPCPRARGRVPWWRVVPPPWPACSDGAWCCHAAGRRCYQARSVRDGRAAPQEQCLQLMTRLDACKCDAGGRVNSSHARSRAPRQHLTTMHAQAVMPRHGGLHHAAQSEHAHGGKPPGRSRGTRAAPRRSTRASCRARRRSCCARARRRRCTMRPRSRCCAMA